MKRRVRVDANPEIKGAPWFDSACREAKRKAKYLLKAFRRTQANGNDANINEK